jgi:hypothetical protein
MQVRNSLTPKFASRGRPNECHRNAALFWLKGKCAAITIGYYLGSDRVISGVSILGG